MSGRNLSAKTVVLAAVLAAASYTWMPLQAQAPAPAKTPSAQQQRLRTAVDEAYQKFKGDTKGKNADYIPYLAKVNSNLFGASVVTTDGQVYSVGDIKYSFSIQSISKVYSLALAMNELGAATVFSKIGSEPTGRAFNSVTAVVEMPTHTGNPLVNAGAIATVSLIPAHNAAEKWNKILNFYSDAAGEKLSLIDEVYKSEAATNQGNRALAALLLKYDRIYADPMESVDVYTKQCSVGVNTAQLGMMAATLANNGKNPGHRQAGNQTRERSAYPRNHDVCRPLRWFRRMGLDRRPSRQEWCRRRHHRGDSRRGCNRRLLAPAR